MASESSLDCCRDMSAGLRDTGVKGQLCCCSACGVRKGVSAG